MSTWTSPAMKRALEFIREAVVELQPRRIALAEEADEGPIFLWSDAMWQQGEGRGGWVAAWRGETGEWEAMVAEGGQPEDAQAFFEGGRGIYIGQGELLWAFAPYYTCPALFRDRQVVHFIDNSAAVAALVKGYSKAMDSGLIVNGMHAALMALRCEPYFAYVHTKDNVADLPSRRRSADARRVLRRAGIHKGKVAQVEPRLPRLRQWKRPVRDWFADAAQF